MGRKKVVLQGIKKCVEHIKDSEAATNMKSNLTPSVGSIHELTNEEILGLQVQLLSWYDENKRDLPWRKNNQEDLNERAYATWVSEIMLQQTQVATVIDYYNKWMKKWPTVEALAGSNVEEVNEAWSGLGYYSRGRRLLEGAQKVVAELGGEMPKTAQDLEKKLPGVGRYTAAAIASIAFGEVTGLVDGNIVRVLSRLRAIGANSTQTDVMEKFWQLAHQVVDLERPGDFNQSLMELGATVCTPKLPQCKQCPVKGQCKAYHMSEADKLKRTNKICTSVIKEESGSDGIIDIECLVADCRLCLPPDSPWDPELGVLNFPRKPKKASVKQEVLNVVVLHTEETKGQEHKYFICQRPPKGLLAGLWEFPSCCEQESVDSISRTISNLCGLPVACLEGLTQVGEVNHQFSHVHHLYKVWKSLLHLPTDDAHMTKFDGRPARLITEDALHEAAVSTGMRKVFREYKKFVSTKDKTGKKRKTTEVTIIDPKRKQPSIVDFFRK